MLNQNKQGFNSQTWVEALAKYQQQGQPAVLVTVLGTDGSTPRACGTKMLVSKTDIFDTIGGGHLEYKAIEKARSLLANEQTTNQIEHFPLGATLGQCCGGSAVILFECFIHNKLALDIYGAGHVAHALIQILAQLPVHIRWIDSRAELFPETVANNVQIVVDEDPVAQVKPAKSNQAYLILTHNHQLDFELTQAILKRGDSLWLGVIGSITKAKRFCHRLSHRGFSEQQISQMTCPVGLTQVTGKHPMEVAVSIAGQLIELYQNQTQALTTQRKQSGIQWQDLLNLNAIANKPNAQKNTNNEVNL
ncbi:xanthine dehydrogenase accessory protein XdhC [Catenovulum sp. 2E275]|uniref:xanthine dehydrogenase accessory protein XdhC n=1 Tax=Catenovulum sp. 2E275 TaxID=2980497 RepID=UPI0021CFCDB9|nr:xanthine dehydrogenase accessory protein XdhC [Catenovulum sp. 2E275]MCU4676028.1 xanthine dehydrogenase accessory protein XdhC [Catenovulum sp. 2E275]